MSILSTLFDRWKSKWDVAILEAFILKLMDITPRYGGEIVEMSQQVIDKTTKVPTIYGILTRFEDNGLITEIHQHSEIGITRGTSRKYYGLTSIGTKFLSDLIKKIGDSQVPIEFLLSTEEVK